MDMAFIVGESDKEEDDVEEQLNCHNRYCSNIADLVAGDTDGSLKMCK